MRNFDLAIFDIDGTLLDTREYIFQAYEHAAKTHDLGKIKREEIAKHMHPLVVTYTSFFPDADVDAVIATHKQFQEENMHLVSPFAETLTVLKKLKQEKVITAALTNRTNPSLQQTLQLAKIEEYFSEIITPDDVKNPKPHPEPIEKLLKQFGIAKNKAIMIGDGAVDVECGKNAGITTIGVTYGLLGKDIAKSDPDFMVDDIIEILPIFGI